jgi:hypothetical protein
VVGHIAGASQAGPHSGPAGQEVTHKLTQLVKCDVWHDHHMCDVTLTCQLPLAYKGHLTWALKHHLHK